MSDVGSGRTRRATALAATTLLALVVFRLDTLLYRVTSAWSPTLALLADLRVPSVLLILVLVLATEARCLLARPALDCTTVLWAIAWLAGVAVSVRLFGVGRVPLPRWQDHVAFSLTGSFAEELLVRGLVLVAALHLWPARADRPAFAVLYCAVVFSLMHLQYGASTAQLAWTLPAGALLAWMTVRSRSLWPAWVVHVLGNLLTQIL